VTVVLAAAAAILFGCGTYLLLQRELTRIVLGLALLAHGANLFILLGAGRRGRPTCAGGDPDASLLDPLPQAFVLTAIVITFGVTTFLLGLAYRSWVLTQDDVVQDDVEDRRVATLAALAEEEADLAAVEAARLAAAAAVRDDPGDQEGLT
jgi:multicomponent Na+:H+ antiporter subunit C